LILVARLRGEAGSLHTGPFDRLPIAQPQVERLGILTADPSFDAYDVAVVWD
jgi:PIN domain nuclease of toxin-antitoxin system